MQATPASFAIPGMRIPNYRNSARRAIRLVGLGTAGTEAVRRVGRRGLENVAIMTGSAPVGWWEVAGDSRDLNMIVIVCGEGDARLFRPTAGRPDVLVTFVVLLRRATSFAVREPGLDPDLDPGPDLDPDLERARAFSDLFVTTSDGDYVPELIDNLAS